MKTFRWMFTLRITTALMIAAAVSIYSASVAAQTITNGGLTGQMVTRAARVNAASDVTFLTEWCRWGGRESGRRAERATSDARQHGLQRIHPRTSLPPWGCSAIPEQRS